MFYIYILESEIDGTYYIGYSSDINKRLYEHNFGNTGYSKRKRPWKLIYSEKFDTKVEAIKREKYLKALKSKKYIQKLVGPVAQR